jgi:hypothetical protein
VPLARTCPYPPYGSWLFQEYKFSEAGGKALAIHRETLAFSIPSFARP